MWNECESGAGCLRAGSGPIVISRKRTFREVWKSCSRAGKTLSLCTKGCHTAVRCVPSVGAVKRSVHRDAAHTVLFLRFKLETSESNLKVLLPGGEILATMPCMPCRSPASCFSFLVMFAMHFLFLHLFLFLC